MRERPSRRFLSGVLIAPLLLLACVATVEISAQEPKAPASSSPEASEPLPLDPRLTIGKLDNGLTYYVRQNRRPEKRLELRLVVNAGSVLEEDDQRGLAHFVEHMAFNGTRNFAKQELVHFLESIGTQYGADVNAFTSFNETLYSLHVPTDSAAVVEKAFQILKDWAQGLSLEDSEIEQERRVVIEEWRQGRGAEARMRDEQLPILFKGSRYAERLPIGTRENLESFSAEALRRFYRDWYRPDLMAVVAVGDVDRFRMERLIRDHFSSIPKAAGVPLRKVFDLPDHDETLLAIVSDPEASRAVVAIHHKQNAGPDVTLQDYRRSIVELLYNDMLNTRLSELTRNPEPPFLYAFSSLSPFTRSERIYVLGATVEEDGFARGLEAILTEIARIRRHGFTRSELDRHKGEMLRHFDQAYHEREKTESADYASLYSSHFLIGTPAPGIEYEHEQVERLLPGIALEEVNRLAGELIGQRNRVITVGAPEKQGVPVPEETDVLAVFEKVESGEVSAYRDEVSSEPLIATPPTPGAVVAERMVDRIGVTEWRLSNGIRVVLKPTDFKNDEIVFTAFSPGGHSLVADVDFVPGVTASAVVHEAGVGAINLVELQKILTGKIVSVDPYVSELQEGLYGQASAKDLETMFQLIHLYFTAPRRDSTAFASLRTRMRGAFQNRSARPESALEDTLQVALSQGHFRREPWSEETFDRMDLHRSFEIYRSRFADAGGFTFTLVGSFKPAEIRPLIATYLASLPSSGDEETWRDVGVRPPRGVIEKRVRRGLEPKSEVRIVFTGPFSWNRRNRLELRALAHVLETKLREAMREEKGGAYSVEAFASASRYPDEQYTAAVAFACAPERVQELTDTVFEQIGSLKSHGPTGEELNQVQETLRRDREENLRENRYWLSVLEFYYFHGEDPATILDDEKLIRDLSTDAIQKAAGSYLDTSNYVKVVLDPEAGRPSP